MNTTATQGASTSGDPVSSTPSRAPQQTFRLGNVSVSIFENQSQRDGHRRTYPVAKLEKNYRNRDGAWQKSSSFSLDELLRLRLLVDRTIQFLSDQLDSSSPVD